VAYCHRTIDDAVTCEVTTDAIGFEIVAPTGTDADAFRLIERWVWEKVPEPAAGTSLMDREQIARWRDEQWMYWYFEGGPWGRILERTHAERYQAAALATWEPERGYDCPALTNDGRVKAARLAMRQASTKPGADARASTRYWAELLLREYPESVEAHQALELLNDLDRYRRPVVPPADRTIIARR
jgi:hypothetical protein